MTFEEILPEIRKGRLFKRASDTKWLHSSVARFLFDMHDFNADDWELKPEERPKERMKAWVYKAGGNSLFLMSSNWEPPSPPSFAHDVYIRAPWLDEPGDEE